MSGLSSNSSSFGKVSSAMLLRVLDAFAFAGFTLEEEPLMPCSKSTSSLSCGLFHVTSIRSCCPHVLRSPDEKM
eukprot:10352039-Ditylum_brightwellii.AAC.1